MARIRFGKNTGTKPEILKTYIHNYSLDIRDDEQKKQYDAIKEARTVPVFAGISGGKGTNLPDREIELETKFVFDNQWNTKDGFRVFDWNEEIYPGNRSIKEGHYLDITPEMIKLRERTYKCGYCGTEYYGHENKGCWCSKCLDSEDLEESNFPLLRLRPVSEDRRKFQELSDAEKAELMPIYVERQTTGANSRNAAKLRKQRERIEQDYEKTTENAKIERNGLLWLMDHNVSIDNVIFYSHTGRFGFGWRHPVSSEAKSQLLDLLCGFPFPYDIKTEKPIKKR